MTMASRLKTRFHARGPKTLEQRATVIAGNIWRIAQEACRHMEAEGFKIGDDRQVTRVIVEFIAFLVQTTDRIVYGQLSESDRNSLINALGKRLMENVQANLTEFVGPGEHTSSLIAVLNDRFSEYAQCDFGATGPGHAFLRLFGEKVAKAMSATDNKWVVEQVMEIEAPAAYRATRKLIGEVLGGTTA
jgi:hypothetical protein